MTNETQKGDRPFFSLTWGGKGQKPDPDHADAAGTEPALVLLSDDAAGPAVRRMTYFADAAAVREHVDFWYPPEHRDRLIAFWALPSSPAASDEGQVETEALVLVRDHRDPELVSPFSFVDMPHALAFIRREISCGLEPALVVLLWAVPAVIGTTVFGDACVTPDRPPAMERPMQALWNERHGPAEAAALRADGQGRAKSQIEALLSELARRSPRRSGRGAAAGLRRLPLAGGPFLAIPQKARRDVP